MGRTADFFDSYAHDFDAIYGTRSTLVNRLINHFFRKSMRLRYELTLLGCDPIEGKRVIDIGCGPGHYSVALAKAGAKYVLGIDFSKNMVDLAIQRAKAEGVQDRCEFIQADFLSFDPQREFNYAILMGFMDYIEEPEKVIQKVSNFTTEKAFFSFPADGGFLAWQRKIRYRKRCNLFLYRLEQIDNLFSGLSGAKVEIVKIARDYFVTVTYA